MEFRDILIDTSIIIDHLRKKDKSKSTLYKIAGKNKLFISTISIFELYSGATDDRKIQDIEHILTFFEIITFTLLAAEEAGHIYISLKPKNQIIEIRDIFIGATSIVNRLPLVTTNKKHFERIAHLTIVDI